VGGAGHPLWRPEGRLDVWWIPCLEAARVQRTLVRTVAGREGRSLAPSSHPTDVQNTALLW